MNAPNVAPLSLNQTCASPFTTQQLSEGEHTFVVRAVDPQGRIVVGTWGGDYARLLAKNIEDPLLKPKGFEIAQAQASDAPRRTKMIAEKRLPRGSSDIQGLSHANMFEMNEAGVVEQAAGNPAYLPLRTRDVDLALSLDAPLSGDIRDALDPVAQHRLRLALRLHRGRDLATLLDLRQRRRRGLARLDSPGPALDPDVGPGLHPDRPCDAQAHAFRVRSAEACRTQRARIREPSSPV